MSKGPLEKKLIALGVKLDDALNDCQKTDGGNFSASTRFNKALRQSYKDVRDLRSALMKRRKKIKEEFEKTHKHRRGKKFGGPKEFLFKKNKPSKTKSIKP